MRPIQTSDDNLFSDGNLQTGVLGTVCNAEWLNAVQAELLAFLTAANITPGVATNQVLSAVNLLFPAIKKFGIGGGQGTSSVISTTWPSNNADDVNLSGAYTASGTSNMPYSTSVLLHIERNYAAGTTAIQITADAAGKLYWRGRLTSTWTSWATVIGSDTGWGATDAAATIADLDDVTVPSGIYYAPSSTIGTKPISASGIVVHRVYASAGFQMYQPQGADRIFYRRRTGSAWQAWQELPSLGAIQANGATTANNSGTADALVGTYSPAITALTHGMTLFVRPAAANTTTTPTFTPASGTITAKTIVKGAGAALIAGDIAGAGHWLELQYDATLDKWVLQNPANGVNVATSLPNIPVRQTVLGGPIDTSGFPTFLPATSASLSITSQNITASAPFAVAAANGFGSTGALDRAGISTSNLTWAGLTANATNYLYVDVAANGTLTTGSTTLAPTYQQGGARSTTSGQAVFNIAEMSMTVGNGAAAAQAYRVFVGEAVTGASAVTSTVAYAYMGKTIIPDTATLPAGGTPVTKSHNLGVPPQIIEMYITNLTTDNGWAVGDRLYNPFAVSGSSYSPPQIMPNRNALYFVAAWGYGTFNKSSGVVSGVTAANWSYGFIVKRGW